MKAATAWPWLVAASTLAGCAAAPTSLDLSAPPPGKIAPGARQVVIRSVRDERSTPGPAGTERSHLLGHKQRSFAHRPGDLVLEHGSVEALMRAQLAAALRQAGHEVVARGTDPDAPAAIVDVRLRELWVSATPGWFAQTLSADVAVELELAHGPSPVMLRGQARQQRAPAPEAWREVLESALGEFRTAAARQLAVLPDPPPASPTTAPLDTEPLPQAVDTTPPPSPADPVGPDPGAAPASEGVEAAPEPPPEPGTLRP
ncbi:MAG TPA: hypothetical protein VM369_08610 [Candidatus Binatia bacterium]|nr:hypothetical protein [Candidatus Binatia bacterium]